MLDSSQNFFEMFLGGLEKQENVTVDHITIPPISRGTYPGNYIPAHQTKIGNICYHNTEIWNFPVLKTLSAIGAVRRKLKQLLRQYNRENVRIICDPLLMEGLLPAVALGEKYGIPTIGFLTDMPDFADECDQHSLLKSILYHAYNQKIKKGISKLDKHIVLTNAMSVISNQKPWMLLDCIVDETMLDGLYPMPHSDSLPHILYAGKLHQEFGLDLLAHAIPLVQNECVFDIYGDGNYIDQLKSLAQKYNNIHLHGIVPLKEVLHAELSATVLVNPRTSQGEFTKYSFPSKTAEYMLAGVPVVMFHLPGIGTEYNKYICFSEEETAESLAKQIDHVLSMTQEERHQIGTKSKAFVVQNKNNFEQARRVLTFIK